jgi:hypothetical protein
MLTRTPAGWPSALARLATAYWMVRKLSLTSQKTLPCLGQGQLAGTTLEQPHAQARLQLGDVLADRRRGQRQAPGGFGKAAHFSAADKAFKVTERFHGLILNQRFTQMIVITILSVGNHRSILRPSKATCLA